jgi:ribonuclease HI
MFAEIYARRREVGPKPLAVTAETPPPDVNHGVIHFDGSCAPNPGPMGVGYRLDISEDSGRTRVLAYGGGQVGMGTNNQAEYHALLIALRHALRLGVLSVTVRSDSNLLVRQINGDFRVTDAKLKRLHTEALGVLDLFHSWQLHHIPREENVDADALSRQLVLVQPELGKPVNANGQPAALFQWQAALIRWWWLTGRRNSYRLARIFDLRPTQVEKIGAGKSYVKADFAGLPKWSHLEIPRGEA